MAMASTAKRVPNQQYGCTDHLLHLAAGKASSKLLLNIEDLLADIFFDLDKSHKRHLREFQVLYGVAG